MPSIFNTPKYINTDCLSAKRQSILEQLNLPKWHEMGLSCQRINGFKTHYLNYDGDTIEIGKTTDLNDSQASDLMDWIKQFIPWRVGPYRIFGQPILSEWRCQYKWERIAPHLINQMPQKIVDIGANNGYFLYKALLLKPEYVVGCEPVLKHYLSFQTFQSFYKCPELGLEPMRAQELLPHLISTVDAILCLGVLYHLHDPLDLIQKIQQALKPGGIVYIDCMGIDGTQPIALTPSGKYMGTNGNWFLPTVATLQNWLHRKGFRNIECIYSQPLQELEQSKSEHSPFASLAEGLMPNDPNLTIEGYPAPWRHYLIAQK